MYHLRAVTFQFFVNFAAGVCQFVLVPQACTFFCFRENIVTSSVPDVISYEIDVRYLPMCQGHNSFEYHKKFRDIFKKNMTLSGNGNDSRFFTLLKTAIKENLEKSAEKIIRFKECSAEICVLTR